MLAVSLAHELADHLQVLYGAAVALVVVVLLTPAVGGMARLLGVVDKPDGRRLNVRPIPRLGGLALFLGIIVPALAFLDLSRETRGLLLGAAVATTVGAIDDFRGLRWWEKLGGQTAAAAIPVGFGIWVHRFTFAVLRRLKYGESVFTADQTHLHYRFLRRGFTQQRAAVTIWIWCGTLAAAALTVRFVRPHKHGEWHPWRTPNTAGVGLVALPASLYIVYVLEIVKLTSLRPRRREKTEDARA